MTEMVWRLRARVGDREQRLLLGDGAAIVGSSPECDHVLADPTVSRHHARLLPDGERIEVRDLDSRNGIWIDDARIDGVAMLTLGQRLRLGDVELMVERIAADDAIAADATAADAAISAPLASPAPATMIAAGVVRFCLREVEPLLVRAADGAGGQELAALVTNALVRAQAGTGAAIYRGSQAGASALIASAGRLEGDALVQASGRNLLRIHGFPSEDRPGVESLARMLLSLLILAERPSLVATATATQHPPVTAPVAALTSSVALREIYRQASRLARSRLNVLITGESGTGKELLAKHLHEASGESDELFLVLNCAALPPDLLDAELFGIESGIATGVQARAGRFELAHGGTVFLDEIGDMKLDTQARILRVLQEKQVYRVGSHKPRPADVRVIAATHRDLPAMVKAGTFRLDLYHRIADWRAELPALRERREDVAGLAALFLGRACQARGVRSGGLSKTAVEALCAHDWPGNVRELEREMARLALFVEDDELVSSDLLRADIRAARKTLDEDGSLAARLAHEERRIIAEALERHRGRIEQAALELGISKATLYRRLAKVV